MAHQGQEIFNPRTGQKMTFTRLDEAELQIDSVNPPTDEREPVHVHPRQESGARVLEGRLIFEVEGKRQELGAGDDIVIPAGAPHRFWNEDGTDARSIQYFRPALDIAGFFELLFALAAQDKLDDSGMPSLMQLAVMVPEFGDEIRTVRPPWIVTRAVCAMLAPIARARGYRGRLDSDS